MAVITHNPVSDIRTRRRWIGARKRYSRKGHGITMEVFHVIEQRVSLSFIIPPNMYAVLT